MKTVLLEDICFFEKGTTGLAKAVPGKYPCVAIGDELLAEKRKELA